MVYYTCAHGASYYTCAHGVSYYTCAHGASYYTCAHGASWRAGCSGMRTAIQYFVSNPEIIFGARKLTKCMGIFILMKLSVTFYTIIFNFVGKLK